MRRDLGAIPTVRSTRSTIVLESVKETMDLPIESSQSNDELVFEALTENIPKRRSPVRVYLVPAKKEAKGAKDGESRPEIK